MKAPAFLASQSIWLIWRMEQVEGETKPRKVPYYANGSKRYGVQGRPEDRIQLVTFDEAIEAAAKRKFTGIGLATLDGAFTVLDFDKCMVDGKLIPEIETMAAGTYAEYSPSGQGVHIFVTGNLTGNNKSMATAEQFGLEAFSTKGFVTYTGKPLEITQLTGAEDTIEPPGPELSALIKLRFGDIADDFGVTVGSQEPLGVPEATILEALDVLDNEMHYDHWLMVGMAIHHETGGEGFDLWDQWSARSSKYTSSEYGQGKWESFGRNPSRQVTIRTLIQMANEQGARITVNAISLEEFDDLGPSDTDGETFGELPDTLPTSPVEKFRFPVIPAAQFAVQMAWHYIIKGLLPKAALGVLFGESGSGKSFIMLDMCIAIARGIPWRGLRTTQGRVVYLVAEGAAGFRNRLIAYARFHKIDLADIPLDIIDATPNLLLKEDALDICKAILATGPRPLLVVVDTFAQALAGANENASEDMGKALAHCKGMHKALGSMIQLVHHCGKDSSKGARGWSGLRAAADSEHEVTRTILGRSIKSTKQKDGADFKEWGFALEQIGIGEDEDGDVVTSCVVIEAEVPVVGSSRRLGPVSQAVLNVMSELALIQTAGIEVKAVVAQAVAALPPPEDGKRDTRAQKVKRALNDLCEGDDAPYLLEDDGTLTIL